MKKLTMLLVLALSFMNLTIVKADDTSNEPEFIDVTVTAKFEETDYQGHAKKPSRVDFNKRHQISTSPVEIKIESHSLTKEENYTKTFEGLEKYSSTKGYDFFMTYNDVSNNPELEYYRLSLANQDAVEMLESGEVVFEFFKARTKVNLTLQVGELKNEYLQECPGGEAEPEEDEDETYAFYSLVNEDQSETSEVDDLSGAVFELLDENNKTIHSATTDTEGKLTFEGVLYGEYKVKQISAPKGLKVDETLLDIDVYKEGDAEDCYGEVFWYNELAPNEPIAEDPEVENPEVEKPEVEKPEVEKPEVEKPEVEKPEVEKPEIKEPKEEKLEAPNTGVSTTYLTYILVLFSALLSLVIKHLLKSGKQAH